MTNEERLAKKEERTIKRDRMRYAKNKLSSGLALAAIVFDVLYFVSIYKSDVGSYYYQWIIGVSIIYNLLFMLMAFLSSEGVKAYKMGYSFVLLAIGIGQIVRIFILPEMAHNAVVTVMGEQIQVMRDSQYMWVIFYLIASAICCLAASITSMVRNLTLSAHVASLENKNA